MNLFKKLQNRRKARKGFSLVELVVVILIIAILALAVFAGGSAVIKKAQVSRTTSDLHNFSVAIESFLNENPGVANTTGTTGFDGFINKLNANLPADYALESSALLSGPNANITLAGSLTNAQVFKSAKTDAWDNNYYVILDSGERHGENNSDFYVYAISAGPDAKTDLGGTIGGTNSAKADDIFLLAQYTNGDVAAETYDMSESNGALLKGKDGGTNGVIASGTATYCQNPSVGLCETSPVNF